MLCPCRISLGAQGGRGGRRRSRDAAWSATTIADDDQADQTGHEHGRGQTTVEPFAGLGARQAPRISILTSRYRSGG